MCLVVTCNTEQPDTHTHTRRDLRVSFVYSHLAFFTARFLQHPSHIPSALQRLCCVLSQPFTLAGQYHAVIPFCYDHTLLRPTCPGWQLRRAKHFRATRSQSMEAQREPQGSKVRPNNRVRKFMLKDRPKASLTLSTLRPVGFCPSLLDSAEH